MDALHRMDPVVSVGERLVVRFRLPDGRATDAVGWVTALHEGTVVLRDHRGSTTTVDTTAVVAARRLPLARGGRDPARTSAAELQQVALPGWLADSEPMGEWTLRAAGGFTGRANSCLAVGDPGIPLAQATGRIVAYAAGHGARPWAQVIEGSQQEEELQALGWREVYVTTDVLAARLTQFLDRTLLDTTERRPCVIVDESLQPAWEQAYRVSRPDAADPAVTRRILENGAPRALARAGDEAGRVIAIGRGHVGDDWLGIAAVWTDPGHRRQGWATAILAGLALWGARRGARSAYLQVAADNVSAHRAYERLGFRHHHRYRYLAPGD